MSDHLSLAARRAALVRQCAEQRDQLALELLSLRGPLEGGSGGGLRGLLLGRFKRPLMIAAFVAGALALKRTRGLPFTGKLMSLWQMAQPLVSLLRRGS